MDQRPGLELRRGDVAWRTHRAAGPRPVPAESVDFSKESVGFLEGPFFRITQAFFQTLFGFFRGFGGQQLLVCLPLLGSASLPCCPRQQELPVKMIVLSMYFLQRSSGCPCPSPPWPGHLRERLNSLAQRHVFGDVVKPQAN